LHKSSNGYDSLNRAIESDPQQITAFFQLMEQP